MTKFGGWLVAIGLAAGGLGQTAAPVASRGPVLEPYTFEETFDAGSVGPWSSYPPAQDTAYDPTIWVRPLLGDTAVADRALYREITPTRRRDRREGVRRLLDLYVDRSSVLTFRALVDAPSGTDGIDIRFGFADGRDVTIAVEATRTGTWVDGRVAFDRVLPDAEWHRLDAVAFMATFPDAVPRSLHRLGLDDVRLTGRRAAQWAIETPPAHRLDELRTFVAASHASEGDGLSIRARTPVDATSAWVRLSRGLTGESFATVPMSGDGREWTLNLPVGGVAAPPAGLWRAELIADTVDGRAVQSSLVFLVRRRDAPRGHPRLFTDASDRDRMEGRRSRGQLADVWAEIEARARTEREQHHWTDFQYNLDAYDRVHWLPTYTGYVTAIGTPARYIRDNAVVHALTGDEEAGEAARQALLQLTTWPTFVHRHLLDQGQFSYWPVGLTMIDLALGYDMVHDRFTADERRRVAAMLVDQGVVPVGQEYVRDNRVSSNTSNWISHVTGGGILSALAVLDEVEDGVLEPHLTGMILKLGAFVAATFDPDGSYGEGYSYANFTMQTLGEIMPALDRTFGIRFPASIGQAHRFLLYQMDPERRRILDFGDTNDHFYGGLPSFANFADALARWRDPHLRWLYDLAPGRTDRDLFFADLDVEPKTSAELPRAVHFREVGTTVFRSGFGPRAFSFVFRAGPFYNHQHFDQGSFFLADRGEDLVVEVGKTDYYADPWYQPLAIQAGGHSTILIDDDPESQRAGDFRDDVPAWRDRASITQFLSWEEGAFVSARLGPLYEPVAGSVDRSVVWLAPRTIVLIDEVIGRGASRTANLRLHAPRRDDLVVKDQDARIERPGATLAVRSFGSAALRWRIASRPLTLAEFAEEDAFAMRPRGFLQLDVPLGDRPTTTITVLSTDTELVEGAAMAPGGESMELIVGATSMRINTTGTGRVSAAGLQTDALVHADTAHGRWVLRATHLSDARGLVLAAAVPVSAVIEPDRTIRISAPAAVELTLRLDVLPTRVSIDDVALSPSDYRTGTGPSVTVTVSPGESILRYR